MTALAGGSPFPAPSLDPTQVVLAGHHTDGVTGRYTSRETTWVGVTYPREQHERRVVCCFAMVKTLATLVALLGVVFGLPAQSPDTASRPTGTVQVVDTPPPQVTLEMSQQSAGWISFNKIVNDIGDDQGVPVGSWEWIQGGVAPWSGSSGTHAAYGWRHDHKLTKAYIQAVIANYAHRRTYYANAPYRQYGYAGGGRPKGWTPELPGDNPDGSATYLGPNGFVVVSGPEVEHAWYSPLFAVLRGGDVPVMALGKSFPAKDVARVLITLQVRSICGQIREKGNQPFPHGYGDRANSRILDTILQGFRYGCIDKFDAELADKFIRNVLLPFYESAPGISHFELKGSPTPQGKFSIGMFNGLYWLLPVFHDASQLLPDPKLQARFAAIVKRWSQWAKDIEAVIPGRGFNAARVLVDARKFRAGDGGKPLASIAGLFDKNAFKWDFTWETWAFRAADTAAHVTGDPVLKAARDGILNRRGRDPNNRVWMVGHDREYVALPGGDPPRPNQNR